MATAVLGATGFIGSHVARALIECGDEVLVFGRHAPPSDETLEVWDRASERCIIDLEESLPDFMGADRIFNFAADMGGVGYFTDAQVGPFITNSRITFNVLEACEQQAVDQVFLASSACAYPIGLQMNEGVAPLLSEDLLETGAADQMYGREKLMTVALSRHLSFDCRVGILHTIYGDDKVGNLQRMKFPTAVAMKAVRALSGRPLEIWGDGSQLRSYLWIDDAVSKILAVMEGPPIGPVNIGKQGAISVNEVTRICCDHLGIKPEVIYRKDKPTGVQSRDCSNAKFWSVFGEMEPVDYQEGFATLVDRVRMNMSAQ